MDTLILSCGTGGGHNSAGRAVEQALTARGHSVTFLDPFTLHGPRTAEAVNSAYISMAQRAPHAFGAAYALGNAVRGLPGKSPVYYANRGMASILRQYLAQRPCDAIVMPHLFPAEVLTAMKRQGLPVPRTFFVATDYTCIPFTEETECDFYITPSPKLTEEFAGRGIPREKIFPLGIPVSRDFTNADRAAARERLGLSPEERYILTAGGSIGAGSLRKAVETLLECAPGARVAVICGSNRALYERLGRDLGGRCQVLGLTDQMADHMAASDVFVSKPGGLSSTEAAILGTALIHLTPIPGCETRNMDFFAENGMCLPVTHPKRQLPEALNRLSQEPERARLRQNQRACIPQNAAESIADLIESACAS